MRKYLALALAAALLPTLAACSDDGSSKASATPSRATREYCTQLQQIGEKSGDPGIDALFAEHPDPTLADWAAFLPGAIAKMRAFPDQVEQVQAPADLPEKVSRSVADGLVAYRRVASNFEAALTAAQSGNQAAYDAAEARNQDTDVPAMEQAFARVDAACGIEDSSKG